MTSVPSTETPATREREPYRWFALPSVAAATSLVWLLAEKGVGLDLRQPAFNSSSPADLSIWFAVAVAVAAAVLAWGTLALVERVSARGRKAWLFAAVGLFLLTLGGPLSGHGVSIGDRVALLGMHVVAAAVMIPLLYLGSSKRTTS